MSASLFMFELGLYADSSSYVWGDNVHKAKTQCESIDYILQLAVEMKKLGLPWTK